ncbi:MAG: hypothetical protein QM737_13405 [Ferruginibacter sp.]
MSSKLSGWDDTIVALATAPGIGAIGVIRLSGPVRLKLQMNFFLQRIYWNNHHILFMWVSLKTGKMLLMKRWYHCSKDPGVTPVKM